MKYPSPEFDNAIAALCHGAISDDVLMELHELLLDDANSRDEYLWRVELHGELASSRLGFGCSTVTDEADEKPVTRASSTQVSAFSRQAKYMSAVVAALIVVVALSNFFVWQKIPPNSVGNEVVARFVEVDDCRWMDPATQASSGDAVRVGQRIELSSGTAEVLFNTGARLSIVGPAMVEPRTDNRVFLTFGEVHLVAGTPESKGFTVATPTSTFVDISTSFTARVSPDGLSRLNVSEGEVDVILEGVDQSPRLRAGETLYVEPGERQIMTRIEEGDGTAGFRFPTIPPPSREDAADHASKHATIRVASGELRVRAGHSNSGPVTLLIDGRGQSQQDAPRESVFFEDHTSGSFLIDLGREVSINRINSYSWHQHDTNESHRHRARQRFTLYGYAGDQLPDLSLPPSDGGWTRIARVNSDRFFQVATPLDRPAQQASSITAAHGEIGQFRYLLWEVAGNTFFGELDVFGSAIRPGD